VAHAGGECVGNAVIREGAAYLPAP
jgi:hypothetical protein